MIFSDEYLVIDSIRTRVRRVGMGGSGIPALFVHGLGGFAEVWDDPLRLLAGLPAGRRPLAALDLPGHGAADKPRAYPYAPDYLALFVLRVMDRLGYGRVHLVAHSLGGGVALKLAAEWPERLASLTLVCPAGLGPEVAPVLRFSTLPGVGEWLNPPSRESLRGAMLGLVHDPRQVTEARLDLFVRYFTLPGMQPAMLKTLRAGANVLGQRGQVYEDLRAGLAAFDQPVMAVWGLDDQIIPAAHARFIQQCAPHAQIAFFERCGHMPMVEYAEQFVALWGELHPAEFAG